MYFNKENTVVLFFPQLAALSGIHYRGKRAVAIDMLLPNDVNSISYKGLLCTFARRRPILEAKPIPEQVQNLKPTNAIESSPPTRTYF